MLPLNPSWGSESGVDSSMKQSAALWLSGFYSFHCISGCLHSLQTSFSLVVYQVQEVFFFKKGEKRRKTLALEFTPSTPGGWRVVETDRKTFLTFYKWLSLSFLFGQTKSPITSNLSLGARRSPQKPDWLCTLSWAQQEKIAHVCHVIGTSHVHTA